MGTALLPLVVMVGGLCLWGMGSGKSSDAGRGLFFIGAFFVVAALAHVTLRLL